MNPKIKRLLSMLLALVMVHSMLAPVTASAASTTAVHNSTVEIEVGETAKLKISGIYSKTTWTSSDEAIATVSGNGTVTGIAPGTAIITAISKNFFSFFGGVRKTTFTVIVTGEASETPTEPEAEELTVKVAETLQLEVKTNGGKVTWKSSDEDIATVNDNGLVTGVSEGDTTITATEKKTVGGSWFFWWLGGKTTTTVTEFKVTVLPGDEQPTEPAETEAPTEPVETEAPTESPKVTYTVTFNSNGGSEVAVQTVEDGMTAIEPEEPTLDGYTFIGWYADEELTQEYDFAMSVTSDVTLYAKWEQNEPARPTMPENPSEADEYYWNNSEVIEVIVASESEVVPNEAEVIDLLASRGFTESEIIYDFTIDGTYIGSTNVQHASQTKRPAYFTYHRTENGDLWIVYVINDAVTAYPLSYNAECDLPVDLMISELETITSYVDETNQYYVTIPYESAMIVRIVERIDAETLEQLTFDAIDAMG